MDLGIKGRVALVAASSQGLGYACARALAAEGARVAINGRSQQSLAAAATRLREELDADVLPVQGDVSRAEDLRRIVGEVRARFGPVQILVTNTGGPTPGLFDDKGDEDWQAAFDSTLMNVVRMVRLVLPDMRDTGWGRVVNITSSAVKEPVGNLLLSNSVRPAVHGLTKSLANELGGQGVLVNTVQPGFFLTQRLEELAQKRVDAGTAKNVDEALAAMGEQVPVGRVGDPDELGRVVAFLASEAASYVHGTTVLVDGGRTEGTSY